MRVLNAIKNIRKKFEHRHGGNGFSLDEHGKAVVDVGAENYDDVFSAYCYKGGDRISDSLKNYLHDKTAFIPIEYDICIKFHIKDANESKKQEIEEACKIYYDTEILNVERKLRYSSLHSAVFFLFGLVMATFYLIFNKTPAIAVKFFLELFAWIFLWESVLAFFLERSDLKYKKFKLQRLRQADIEVVEFENY